MMRIRRIRGPATVLAVAWLLSPAAFAHDDDAGAMGLHARFDELGSNGGYFNYEIVWRLSGRDEKGVSHNKYVNQFFRIEWSPNRLDPWYTYANIKGRHTGRAGPVPTQRWYRFRGGGNYCFLDICWRSFTSAPMWRPATACNGSGTGDGGRIGPY